MTDRMAALERVAEAARAWNHAYSRTIRGAGKEHRKELSDAIDALDALPAEPVGETVTMALIRSRGDGGLSGTMYPDQEDPRDWEYIGNITFPMPPAIVIPTISATVTAGSATDV